jgi:hypothetical protein
MGNITLTELNSTCLQCLFVHTIKQLPQIFMGVFLQYITQGGKK